MSRALKMMIGRTLVTSVLSQATNLWQAKNYSGSGAWLDEKGSANFQFGSASGADSNDPLWLPYSTSQNPFGANVKYVRGQASSGNGITVPDPGFVGPDFDLLFYIGYDSACIATKFGQWSASGYAILVTSSSTNITFYYNDGSTRGPYTIAHGLTSAGWARIKRVGTSGKVFVSAGGSPNTVPTSGSWTEIADHTLPTTTLNNPTTNWEILSHDAVTSGLDGAMARLLVVDGDYYASGTVRLDFHPNASPFNFSQTTMYGSDSKIYTCNRSTSGRKLAVVDRDKFLLGTDDRFQLDGTATATMPWTGDEKPFTLILFFRYYGTTISGGRIMFGSGRAGVTVVTGVSFSADFSNRFRLHISDGTTGIAGSLFAASTVNGTDSLFAMAYDPTAENISTTYSLTGDNGIRTTTTGTLSDIGTVGNNTSVHVGWQQTDNGYMDMEFVAAALFDKVLTASERTEAIQELAGSNPVTFSMDDTFAGADGTPVNGRITDTGGLTWGNISTIAPLLDGAGAVKLTSNGGASARVLMPTGNNRVLANVLGGGGGSQSSRIGSSTVRHTDQNNFLHAYVQASTGTVAVRKRVSGTFTSLASTTVAGLSNTAGYDVEIQAIDDQIQIWINGTSVLTHTLSAGDYNLFPNTITGAGFWFNGFNDSRVRYVSAESV
jgi:hypothetical protein